MTITCPHCGASGQLDDSKRPAGATSIKCPRCSQSFPLPPLEAAPPPELPPLRPCPACGGVIEDSGTLCNACASVRNQQAVPSNGSTMVPPPLPAAEAEQPSGGSCHVCKGNFSLKEMVRFGDNLICAGCKPTYVQMLSMGMVTSGAPASAGTLTREQILARDYSVDIGTCISSGWEMFKANIGVVLGASILVYLAMGVASMIPFLGSIASLVLTGPFMGGLWMFYIKKIRGENASVNDAFCGFSSNFVQLMLNGMVTTLLSWLVMIVALIPLFFAIGAAGLFKNGGPAAAPSMALMIPAGLLMLVGMAGFTYLIVGWLFSIPLVIDKRMAFWPAMRLSREVVHKQWWMTFLLLTVVGLIATMGMIALFIGVFVTAPVAFAAIVAHYQAVFGDLRPEA